MNIDALTCILLLQDKFEEPNFASSIEESLEYQNADFLILEIKPQDASHPQGNRVLECFEFSQTSLKIKGQPRFKSFNAILSMPQDGAKVEATLEVTEIKENFFEAKLNNPSSEVLKKISWWFSNKIDFVESPPKKDKPSSEKEPSP